MAKKKKIKRFSAVQVVKEMARERIGATPRPNVIPDRKKRTTEKAKHKSTLKELMSEDQ